MTPPPKTIHLDNEKGDAAVCRAGNAKFRMAAMERTLDVRKVNCLSCLRTAYIRLRNQATH